jgi:rubrerythrin
MYPGMAKTAREEGFKEIAELVRDAGQGREVSRGAVHADAEVRNVGPKSGSF